MSARNRKLERVGTGAQGVKVGGKHMRTQRKRETPEEIKVKAEKLRAYLRKHHGINSDEELDEAYEEVKRRYMAMFS